MSAMPDFVSDDGSAGEAYGSYAALYQHTKALQLVSTVRQAENASNENEDEIFRQDDVLLLSMPVAFHRTGSSALQSIALHAQSG